jgi:chlorobactene glucosyltransferase
VAAILQWLLALVAAAVFVVWILRLILLVRSLRVDPRVRAGASGSRPDPAPLVSVVIPARDEESNISECLESIRAQDYPNLEIIVVDDRSTDRTAEIVEAAAREDPRIRLIRKDHLLSGWTGKTHALWVGSREARGKYLLFIDADTRHHPSNLTSMVAYVHGSGADMVTLNVGLITRTFWERVLQPILGGMFMMHFPPAKIADPNHKLAFGNGQYIFVRRSSYDDVGGHEAVKQYLLEDIALAKLLKGRGYKTVLAYGSEISRTRMYTNFADIWRGWVRIFYEGFDRRATTLGAYFVLGIVFSILPFVVLGVGLYGLVAGSGAVVYWLMVVFTAASMALKWAVLRILYSIVRCPPVYLWLHPVAGVISLGILASALAKLFSKTGTTWRGTVYDERRAA